MTVTSRLMQHIHHIAYAPRVLFYFVVSIVAVDPHDIFTHGRQGRFPSTGVTI